MGDKPYVVGIDLGGTNTEIGVVDTKGNFIVRGGIGPNFQEGAVSTGKYPTVNSYLEDMLPELYRLIAAAGGKDKIKGIGIGAPNGNYHKGTIEDAPNLEWAKGKEIELADEIKKATGIPCKLTNDANAAAMGEREYGVAKEKNYTDFIMVTLGTGVGSGIVIDDNVVYGHDGFAGELGHMIMRRNNGRLCGCGRRGCLETYASAPGIALTAREMVEITGEKIKSGEVKTLLTNYDMDKLTSKDVYNAAKAGDKMAIEVFEQTGKILGEAFADFITFSSPEAIVLFGGPTKAREFLEPAIEKSLNNSLLNIFKKKRVKIEFSILPGSDAAVLGASALAWKI